MENTTKPQTPLETSHGLRREFCPSAPQSRWYLALGLLFIGLLHSAMVQPIVAGQTVEATGAEEAEAQPLPVRGLRSHCGGNTRDVRARQTLVRATPGGAGRVRVHIRNLSSYCAPAPAFRAERRGRELRLILQPPTPGTPVARCTCGHNIRLSMMNVPPGEYRLVVEHTTTEPQLREGRWVQAPRTFATTVRVRR